RLVGRPAPDPLNDERVVLVGHHEVFLGGEIAEHRHRGHLRRRRDVSDRGRVIAALGEQPHRVLLNGPLSPTSPESRFGTVGTVRAQPSLNGCQARQRVQRRQTRDKVTAPSRSGPRPVRALVALAAVILIMVISVLGNETLSPGKWQQQFKVSLGLDLSSGTEVVLKAETHDGKPPAGGEMQQAISVLQSRVNGNGISGAQVQQQGSDMINVTVPGKPVYNIVNLVSQASQMSVRPVYLEAPYVPPSADRTNQVAYGD